MGGDRAKEQGSCCSRETRIESIFIRVETMKQQSRLEEDGFGGRHPDSAGMDTTEL